jgi:hypothetical protein
MSEGEGIVVISSDEAWMYKQLKEAKFFELHGMDKNELTTQPEDISTDQAI